jgi:hypothetical protein
MHLSFSLLRINGLYMLRALLAHPQEALNKRRVMSVSCATIPRNIPSAFCAATPEDEQVMLEKFRGP